MAGPKPEILNALLASPASRAIRRHRDRVGTEKEVWKTLSSRPARPWKPDFRLIDLLCSLTQKGEEPNFWKRTKKLDFLFIFDINEKF
jgi:hypothetical protein